MKKPVGELIIASRLEKYPTPPVNDHASLIRWRSFSPFWWAVVQGLIEGLLQPILWLDLTPEIRQQIEALALPEIPECEECEEPANGCAGGGGGGTGMVGITGLSYQELEDFYMSWSLREQLRVINGQLHYWGGDCCGWILVPQEGVSTVAPTAAGLGALAAGTASLTDWLAAGKPETAAGTSAVPSSNEFYTTDESMACVKATAIVDTVLQLFADVRDGVLQSAVWSTGTISAVGALTTFVGHSSAEIWDLLAILWGAAAGTSAVEKQISLDETIDAIEAEKAGIICAVAAKMTPVVTVGGIIGNRATENDYYEAVQTIKATTTPDSYVSQVMDTYPTSSILRKVRERLNTTECGCEDLLPFGYEPPAAPGFRLKHHSFGLAAVSTGNPNVRMYNNLPLEGAYGSLNPGSLVGGWPKTGYLGNDSGMNYTGFGWIVEATEDFLLAQVSWDMVHDAGADRFFSGVSYFDPSTNLWVASTFVQDTTAPLDTSGFRNFANVPCRYFAIHLHSGDVAPAISYLTISALRVSGSVGGVPFANLGLNESLP